MRPTFIRASFGQIKGENQMGMYTEHFINVDLKEDTPSEILTKIQLMQGDKKSPFHMLFRDLSFYTPSTYVNELTYNKTGMQYSFIGKGDIRDIGPFDKFVEMIMPWIDAPDGVFIGYTRYESSDKPELIFKTCP